MNFVQKTGIVGVSRILSMFISFVSRALLLASIGIVGYGGLISIRMGGMALAVFLSAHFWNHMVRLSAGEEENIRKMFGGYVVLVAAMLGLSAVLSGWLRLVPVVAVGYFSVLLATNVLRVHGRVLGAILRDIGVPLTLLISAILAPVSNPILTMVVGFLVLGAISILVISPYLQAPDIVGGIREYLNAFKIYTVTLSTNALVVVNPMVVRILYGKEAAGIYDLILTLAKFVPFAVPIVSFLYLPEIAKRHKNGQDYSLLHLVAVTITATAGIVIASGILGLHLDRVFFGVDLGTPLQIVLLGAVIFSTLGLYMHRAVATGNYRAATVGGVIAIALVPLSFLIGGIFGASVAAGTILSVPPTYIYLRAFREHRVDQLLLSVLITYAAMLTSPLVALAFFVLANKDLLLQALRALR